MYRMTAMLVLKVAKFTNAYWNTKDVADMGRKRRVGEESKAAFAYSYALETISTCMCVCVCVCVCVEFPARIQPSVIYYSARCLNALGLRPAP